jgi:hypothetical protein
MAVASIQLFVYSPVHCRSIELSHAGESTRQLTINEQWFRNYSLVQRWQFQVIYCFAIGQSLAAMHFAMNSPPSGGNCSIHPSNGTVLTLFTVSCEYWADQQGINSYAIYGNGNGKSKSFSPSLCIDGRSVCVRQVG